MKKYFYLLLAVLPLFAHASQCGDLYPAETPIVSPRATELCNTFYVSLFDTSTRSVILVSERLRKNSHVGSMVRKNAFRADPRISQSPSPSEYRGSGYDKGHLAPADDASTPEEENETFLMTNMTPQEPTLNRRGWARLEAKVRKLYADSATDVFVLTIPVYGDGTKLSGIRVPTGYWKVVYANGRKAFFYADNVPNAKVIQKDAVDITLLIK